MYELKNKSVLVTGACGTVGAALVAELLKEEYGIGELVGVDNNESEIFSLDQRHLSDPRARFSICDMRDKNSLLQHMQGIDIVFSAAGLKHVIVCERSPMDAVQTNILGVQNLVQAASEAGVERVLQMSTDKAVNPTSVMGTSKLMGERLMTAANSQVRKDGPVFLSTRFGNVLGSRGSVVPVFANQIARGGPVTLTDPRMTRFIMSTGEAVRLVIESAMLGKGGEVFITKMPVIRIEELARAMIEELAPHFGEQADAMEITEIGSKPGEKLYEELMSDEETRRAVELERYFVVLPAFRGVYQSIEYDYPGVCNNEVTNPYISASEPSMSKNELTALLRNDGLLDMQMIESPPQRYWPGDKEQKTS